MSFKPFESGDGKSYDPWAWRAPLVTLGRSECKARVYIAFILYFSYILLTCSSMHTHRLTRKGEFVFFLNAFPGFKKYFRNVKFGRTWLVWWIKANRQATRGVCLRFKCYGVLHSVERLRVTDVTVVGKPSSSGPYSARRCHHFCTPEPWVKGAKGNAISVEVWTDP